jgi:hypothetical protein
LALLAARTVGREVTRGTRLAIHGGVREAVALGTREARAGTGIAIGSRWAGLASDRRQNDVASIVDDLAGGIRAVGALLTAGLCHGGLVAAVARAALCAAVVGRVRAQRAWLARSTIIGVLAGGALITTAAIGIGCASGCARDARARSGTERHLAGGARHAHASVARVLAGGAQVATAQCAIGLCTAIARRARTGSGEPGERSTLARQALVPSLGELARVAQLARASIGCRLLARIAVVAAAALGCHLRHAAHTAWQAWLRRVAALAFETRVVGARVTVAAVAVAAVQCRITTETVAPHHRSLGTAQELYVVQLHERWSAIGLRHHERHQQRHVEVAVGRHLVQERHWSGVVGLRPGRHRERSSKRCQARVAHLNLHVSIGCGWEVFQIPRCSCVDRHVNSWRHVAQVYLGAQRCGAGHLRAHAGCRSLDTVGWLQSEKRRRCYRRRRHIVDVQWNRGVRKVHRRPAADRKVTSLEAAIE